MGPFLIFLAAQMILQCKKCISRRCQRVLCPGFLASYRSAGFERFLQVSALASAGILSKFHANAGGKRPISAPITLNAIQAG
jgi:hypothetical protein